METKSFPTDYPSDVVKLLSLMAVNQKNIVVGGSSSVKGIAYPADYDAVDTTKTITAKDLKEVIARLLSTKDCCIGDIKCGEIDRLKVVEGEVVDGKVVGYSFLDADTRLKTMLDEGEISKAEYDFSKGLLKEKPSVEEFLTAQKEIKFHIVRWTPSDVLKGYVPLRKGTYSLEEGVKSKGMCKVDVVGFVSNNLFKDFSMIYLRGEEVQKKKIVDALKADILYYKQTDHYKALKRYFSLCRLLNKKKEIERLLPVFNGDLGVLYSLKADIDTLLFLKENECVVSDEKVRYEIDSFKDRITSLYEIKGIVKKDNEMIAEINRLTTVPSSSLYNKLQRFRDGIESLLNKYSLEVKLPKSGG